MTNLPKKQQLQEELKAAVQEARDGKGRIIDDEEFEGWERALDHDE